MLSRALLSLHRDACLPQLRRAPPGGRSWPPSRVHSLPSLRSAPLSTSLCAQKGICLAGPRKQPCPQLPSTRTARVAPMVAGPPLCAPTSPYLPLSPRSRCPSLPLCRLTEQGGATPPVLVLQSLSLLALRSLFFALFLLLTRKRVSTAASCARECRLCSPPSAALLLSPRALLPASPVKGLLGAEHGTGASVRRSGAPTTAANRTLGSCLRALSLSPSPSPVLSSTAGPLCPLVSSTRSLVAGEQRRSRRRSGFANACPVLLDASLRAPRRLLLRLPLHQLLSSAPLLELPPLL